MKKSLVKNNFKEISKTKRRFLSILVMAFLGVGFYAGLVACSPDMQDSLDKYVDNNSMYDINIISTLGLTEDDVNAIQQIDGVESAYGLQSKDTFINFNDKESICKLIEYNENINRPEVINGRLPESSDECLLDEKYVYFGNAEEYIGKVIKIENEDLDEDNNPIFTQKELKIVGIVESPLYISSERGTSSLGSGNISLYIYCLDDVINLDYYTEIAIKVKGAKECVTNSEQYLALVNPVIDEIESIKESRQDARYNSLVDEANKKIDDAQKEYDDKKAEVDQELNDAENKINEAKSELNNSENKLNKSEKELNQKEKDAAKQFENAEQKIKESENQVNATISQIGIETSELTAAKQQIQVQKDELARQKENVNKQIANGRKEISNGRKKIEEGKQELADNEKEFNDKKAEAEQKLANAQQKIDDARADVSKIEKAKWYIQDRIDNTGYSNIFDAITTMKNISKIFPVIFYLVAILISLTSMTRMIEEERIEIGTLKALGYTNIQIISKYILYSFLACIIGGFLGMTVCFYLLPKIVWTLYSMVYTMPHFYMTYRLSIGLMGILIAFICIGGATLIVAYKELKEMPSVLMRPKAPKKGKRILMEKITFIWKRLNFSQKVTIRNIFRYKKRALITVIGIAGCTGLMLAGFGIRDSVADIPNLQFGEVFKYDTSITLANTDGLSQIDEYLSNNENVELYKELYASTGSVSNDKLNYNVTIFVPNTVEDFEKVCNLKDAQTEEKIEIQNDGVIITDKLADEFGIKVNDEITIKDSDDVEYKFKVSGIAKNYVDHYVFMTKELYENTVGNYKTNMIFVNLKTDDKDIQNKISEDILNCDGVASVSVMSSFIKSISDMLNTMNYVVVVLIVTSAMLDFVVLYNLANINIGERQREIATLKVLGFYDKEVDNYINKENVIFTIIGIALGLGFGTLLTSAIISSIEIDRLRFARNILTTSYLWATVITASFSFIVNRIIHFTLKKIDMIESLKSVE